MIKEISGIRIEFPGKTTEKCEGYLLLGDIIINGKKFRLEKFDDKDIYVYQICGNKDYVAIGLYKVNKMATNKKPFGNEIIIISTSTEDWELLKMYKVTSSSIIKMKVKTDETDKIWFDSDDKKSGFIDCQKLFDKRKCIPFSEYRTNMQRKNFLEELFVYRITDDMSVLIELKDGVDTNDLLMYDGFTNEYDAFKIWSQQDKSGQLGDKEILIENCYIMFVNKSQKKIHKSKVGSLEGLNRTCVIKLMKCLLKIIPFHPFFKNEKYYVHLDGNQDKEIFI